MLLNNLIFRYSSRDPNYGFSFAFFLTLTSDSQSKLPDCRKYYFSVMCGTDMFGQWPGYGTWDVGYEEVTRVILMYVDTADCYKVPQSRARL